MDKIKALITYLEETDAKRNELLMRSTEFIYSNVIFADLKEIIDCIEMLADEGEILSVQKSEEYEGRYIVQVGYERLVELTGKKDLEPYHVYINGCCQWEHYKEIVENIELVVAKHTYLNTKNASA